MKRGNPKGTFTVLALALGCGMAFDAGAADPSTTRSAPPPSGTSRAAPAQPPATATTQTAPAAAPTAPANTRAAPAPATPATGPSSATRPAQPGKPDYVITLNSQQEYKNTALGWTFRIENRGNAAPVGEKNTAKTPYGNFSTFGTVSAGKLVISVGQPCPETKYWKALEGILLPVVQPGASVVVPSSLYKMPDEYAGKGCRFRADIDGPAGDANPSNNVMHMITKTAMMPDLRLSLGVDNALVVTNIGNAPAGPSVVHYECRTNDPNIHCGRLNEKWKPEVAMDFEVPALKPGESKAVKGSTPKGPGATWKASADHTHQVAESNEGNNTLTGGK